MEYNQLDMRGNIPIQQNPAKLHRVGGKYIPCELLEKLQASGQKSQSSRKSHFATIY